MAATWDERDLPAPAVRSVVAAVEEASVFGQRCAAAAERLGLPCPEALSVLGDGAAWVWTLSARHFAGTEEVLNVWHGVEHNGVEHISGGPRGRAVRTVRRPKRRRGVVSSGCWRTATGGVTEWVGELARTLPAGGDGVALGEVLKYFAGHRGRLPYAARLRRGQSIGSGLVEGTIKQLVNQRLKQTGARWKVAHVGPLVELGAMAAGPEWQAFWDN